jgi:predicted nucleic acid-binding protein
LFLVDTNVISERRKGAKANVGVREFWKNVDPESVYLSVQTIGEIRAAIEKISNRGDAEQAKVLERWLSMIVQEYADRILVFDDDCAQVWGKLMASQNQQPIDKQIASIALIHGLDVVTRSSHDFAATGVKVINPFR